MTKYLSPLGWLILGCLAFWVLVIGVCVARASPFLTTDCTPPSDTVTGFTLQFGTQPAIDIPAVECVPVVTDGKRILYDLGTMPNGPFSVKALARNAWGSSPYTPPLSGNKVIPGSPSLLRIIP